MPRAKPTKRPRTTKRAPAPVSLLECVVSDIHFNLHDEPTWRAFVKWAVDWHPRTIVFDGDVLDFGMLSPWPQEADAPDDAVEQIDCFVREANALAARNIRLVVVRGNHDERWEKIVLGASRRALRKALGLTLAEQCRARGLDARVQWVSEDKATRGYYLGEFLVRHGHRQSGRFGGGKHLAANRLAKNMGHSEIAGHNHRAQLFAKTAGGRTAVAIANPCMTAAHDYAPDADWQRGFTIVERHAPDYRRATAYPIVMHDGVFAWGGRTYDGNAPKPRGPR
jgi:predicted phosphodiesterase